MDSHYRESDAPNDLLALRCYTSKLLGAEPSLVLHGGGNTSVKGTTKDFFGAPVEVCWVKGSGWDLASIEPAGFPAVRLSVLRALADLDAISDVDLVREQRAALLDPGAPDPSIEAVLHALVPFRFVDHTHADVIVTLTNQPDGEARVRALFGERVLVVPYVMPGFVLAKQVRAQTFSLDWSSLDAIVLMNHGVFTFSDDAKASYERMITLVDRAEKELMAKGAWSAPVRKADATLVDAHALATLRREVSLLSGRAVLALADTSPEAVGFASRADVLDLATRGPLTPDHVIRTKRIPAVVDASEPRPSLDAYADEYRAFFARHQRGHTALDPAPRWAVVRNVGTVAFGVSAKLAAQIGDIARHTVRAWQWGEALGRYTPLGEKELFEVEYWELEQKKLRAGGKTLSLAGKIALVSGGATGIGRAIAERFRSEGAAVCVLDQKMSVKETFRGPDALGLECDVTDAAAVDAAILTCVRRFGGLDLLVSNAGNFPGSKKIAELDDASWDATLALNLSAHLKVLRAATPFLVLGVEPCVVVIASRNVLAPGPGAAAYSVSKAGLTQLARVATLELAPYGVRVGTLHPDKVFDTELWTDEVVAARAKSYGVSVDTYKRQNLLKAEVTTKDVAEAAMAIVRMRATTGAQIPVDGGSDRVV